MARSDAPPDDISEGLEASWSFKKGSGRLVKDLAGAHDAILPSSAQWVPSPAKPRLELFINGTPTPGNIMPIQWLKSNYGVKQAIAVGGVLTLEGDGEHGVRDNLLGLADDIRVWSTRRSAAEIANNRFAEIDPADPHLAANWRTNTGNGSTLRDVTGHGYDLILRPTVSGQSVSEFWWQPDGENESPMGIEASQFRNAITGPTTSAQVHNASSAASTIEYGVISIGSDGRLRAFMNRQSIYLQTYQEGGQEKQRAVFTEDFPVGTLDLQYIGQAQTDPTLIGYIEGAPPVPSENLTTPYWESPARYQAYVGVTSVTLNQDQGVTYTYEAGKDDGPDVAITVGGGFAAKGEVEGNVEPFGFGVTMAVFDAELKIGAATEFSWQAGHLQSRGTLAGRQRIASHEMSAGGDWEADSETENRRYVPDNVGYALVRSSVANVMAMRLRKTGSLIGVTLVPNPKIAPDENIIIFPMNPRYTKQGTLDGFVGFKPDPDFPQANNGLGSYFRPQEAANLERQIDAAEAEAEAKYRAFEVSEDRANQIFEANEGDNTEAQNDQTQNDNEDKSSSPDKWSENLVNSFVWTASGGLIIESQQATTQRTESDGGAFTWSAAAGPVTSFEAASPFGGFYSDSQGLFGKHFDTTISKSREEAQSISLEVTNNCESYLADWDITKGKPSKVPAPGKVSAYRFKTFYLSPQEQWFDRLFDEVIDQNWLQTSDSPDAIALRAAQSRRTRLWRVLHRVTYVARVPEVIDRVPIESEDRPEMAVIDIAQNAVLIEDVRNAMNGLVGPLRVRVAQALDTVFEEVSDTLPWWQRATSETEAVKARALQYLTAFFSGNTADDSEPPR